MTVTMICKGCGKEFEAESRHKKYCSRSCYGITKVCENCGKEFRTTFLNQPYCSRTCGAAHKITKVEKTCMICGKKYIVQKRFDETSKTCSKPCAAIWQGQRLSGKLKVERVIVYCAGCGKEIKKRHAELISDHYYCSRDCQKINVQYKIKTCIKCGKEFKSYVDSEVHCSTECRKRRMIKNCEICGTEFEVPILGNERRKHCSKKCRDISNSRDRRGIQLIEYEKRNCSYCGDIIQRPPSKFKGRKNVYCNEQCLAEHKKEIYASENNPNWQDGASFEPYCKKWTKGTRTRVRAYFGDVCFLCGLPVEEHLDRHGNHHNLIVHHVHYDKQICCNGRPEIMVPLCRPHNGKVNSNKEWWIQYFENILYGPPWYGKTYFTNEEYREAIRNGLQLPDIPRYKGTNKSKL